MFCPRCGHQQVSDEIRFCPHCGLPLNLLTDLLADGSQQLRREKQELRGTGLMIGTVLMLTNFIIVFGVVTLPHLTNPVFLWLWLFFVLSCLIVGGFGLADLIRSGFFRRLKEREARLGLAKAQAGRQPSLEERGPAALDAGSMSPAAGGLSVTEGTTRELDAAPRRAGGATRQEG